MAVTLANIITNLDTYLGDTSTDRISTAERLQAITEATVWLQEELGNEHMMATYPLDYLDGVHYYKVTTGLADLLVGADLRRGEYDQTQSFSRKSPRELAEEIGQRTTDPSWAVERRDGDAYLVVNYSPKYSRRVLDSFDIETGFYSIDGDTNIANIDTNEYLEGTGSLNFDIDVSNSVSNYAIIYNPGYDVDLSDLEDLGSFIFDVYIPDSTYTTSIGLYWSSDTDTTPSGKSNYWSSTVTTDINLNPLTDGWNKIKIDWRTATATGSPDSSAITYFEYRINYTASQGNDTDYRLDNFFIVKPERLTFHYVSWNVGESNVGADLAAFSATTDIPFFSGQYDQYKYAVAHKAAAILYYSSLRLREQGAVEDSEAFRALNRYRKRFETSVVREEKSFKVKGVNLRNKFRRRGPRIR